MPQKVPGQPENKKTEGVIHYTHTHAHSHNGVLLSHREGWNTTLCSNVDGPREYYAQWNKPERERQMLYNITYM